MEIHFGENEQAHSRRARENGLVDLKTLARHTEDLLKATAHDVSDQAREARSRVTAALERAKVTCTVLQEQAVATAKAARRYTDLAIRAHPYDSIGVAFGVGLLMGVLVIRSNRHERE